MDNNLVIIGAGGHGKVIADIALCMDTYKKISFLDDNEVLSQCEGFPVVGRCDEVDKYFEYAEFFVAIGNATIRESVQNHLEEMGARLATLIHPSAVIGHNVRIGIGTVIMAGAVINSSAVVGAGCIINTCASVDHDCEINNYVHISVGAHLAGNVQIGEKTCVGIGAIVINNINICSCCTIGAGAVVAKDISEEGLYIGVPARQMVSKNNRGGVSYKRSLICKTKSTDSTMCSWSSAA